MMLVIGFPYRLIVPEMIKASLQEASTIEEQSIMVKLAYDIRQSVSLVSELHDDIAGNDESDGLDDDDAVVDGRDVSHDASPVG